MSRQNAVGSLVPSLMWLVTTCWLVAVSMLVIGRSHPSDGLDLSAAKFFLDGSLDW